MLFSFFSLSALGAISFLSHALTSVAGYAQLHRQPLGHQHMPRVPPVKDVQRATNHRRAGVHSVEVPLQELQMLQSESTTFRNWMSSWFSSASGTDSGVAGLKQEFQAYDGWISSWLDIAMSTNASAPSPIPSSVPLSTTESSPALPMTKGGELFQPSLGTVLSISQKSFGTAPPVSTPPASTSATPASVAPPTATSAPIPTTPSTGSCKFNAQASDNLAVYYGQTGATGQITLGGLCQDSNVNIVIVAFLTTYFGPGGYPTVNFGAACGSHQTSEMASKGATGPLSCPDLAEDITKCQDLGKLVLLSLGGADATTAFSSDSQATTFATQLWNLFGAGTGEDPGLRPFGDVKVDGFDIDNEDHSTTGYSSFVSSLRSTMDTDTSKQYYISAAPQCVRPDASIPLDAMQAMDFIWVQFYNNGDCNIGQSGFDASFKAWSGDVSAKGAGPRLYIGAPGCLICAGSGYLEGAAMTSQISSAKGSDLSNFGGVMLWDGPEAMFNTDSGQDYLTLVKSALG